MKQDKLLPCPFCGGEAEISTDENNSENIVVGCNDLDCHGYLMHSSTWPSKEDAKRAWNSRPQSHDRKEVGVHDAHKFYEDDPQPNMNIKIGGTCKVCNRPIGMCACVQFKLTSGYLTETPAGKKLGVEEEAEYKKVEGYAFPQYALSVFLRKQPFLSALQADLLAESICQHFSTPLLPLDQQAVRKVLIEAGTAPHIAGALSSIICVKFGQSRIK